MIKTSVFVCVLVFPLALLADDPPKGVDPETYRKALEKLNSKPSAEPAEIDRLRTENAELKKEVEALRTALTKANAKIDQLTPTTNDKPLDLKMGMTIEEVQKVLGPENPGWIESESEGYKTIFYGSRGTYGTVKRGTDIRSIRCTFRDGRLTDIVYDHASKATQKIISDRVEPDAPPKKTPPPPPPAKPSGKRY